jgi:hypothetical protein
MMDLNFSPRLIGVTLRQYSSRDFLADPFEVSAPSLFLPEALRNQSPNILQAPGCFVSQAKLLQAGWRYTRQGTTNSLRVDKGE